MIGVCKIGVSIAVAAFTMISLGCSEDSGGTSTGATTGPAACAAAGGTCVMGGTPCAKRGTADCNPQRNPGGAFCCLDTTESCTDANVQMIEASDYDQTCSTSADCVAVGTGNACYACAMACPTGAINKSALTRYQADVASTPGGATMGSVTCNCPVATSPCCVSGVCHADAQCF